MLSDFQSSSSRNFFSFSFFPFFFYDDALFVFWVKNQIKFVFNFNLHIEPLKRTVNSKLETLPSFGLLKVNAVRKHTIEVLKNYLSCSQNILFKSKICNHNFCKTFFVETFLWILWILWKCSIIVKNLESVRCTYWELI
jgi:hypothetical protein